MAPDNSHPKICCLLQTESKGRRLLQPEGEKNSKPSTDSRYPEIGTTIFFPITYLSAWKKKKFVQVAVNHYQPQLLKLAASGEDVFGHAATDPKVF